GQRAPAVGRDRGPRPARRVHDREHAGPARDRRRSAHARVEAGAEAADEGLRRGRAEVRSPCEDPSPCEEQVTSAVLAPGYGGTAAQPLLVRLAKRLEADGIATSRITFSAKRPSRGYATEKRELRA